MSGFPSNQARTGAAIAFALVSVTVCVCVYTVAVGSARGRALDAQTLGPGAGPSTLPDVRTTSLALVRTIDIGSFVLLGAAIVAVALVRRRRDLTLAIVILLGAANATTLLLKPLLQRLDPFGGDRLRVFHGSFPSGHATIALSLAIALVFAAPPRLKPHAALLGTAYAAAVGVSLMAQRWHYASDVAGGFLVVAAWAGIIAAFLSPPTTLDSREPLRQAAAIAVPLAAVFVSAIAVAVHRHPAVLVHLQVHRTFVAAAVALVLLAVCVTLSVAALTARTA